MVICADIIMPSLGLPSVSTSFCSTPAMATVDTRASTPVSSPNAIATTPHNIAAPMLSESPSERFIAVTSSNTCPRCPLQRRQCFGTHDAERAVDTRSGAQKLGHPVWLSNLVLDEKTGSLHPAQVKVPERCSSFKALL